MTSRNRQPLERHGTIDWSGAEVVYFLGVGGPESADDVGHVDRFAWRFLVLTAAGTAGAEHTLFAFTSMPKLMAFTREVNARAPFTVPTEALRLRVQEVGLAAETGVIVDPAPADFAALADAGRLTTVRLPDVEAGERR